MTTQAQPRKRRASRYARLPRDARLLVRVLEYLLPQLRYAEGSKHTSRIQKAMLRVLSEGSEEGIRVGRKPGEWYIKSESRPKLNRWYAVSLQDLTCDVDTSRIVVMPNVHIDERLFFCEDFKRNGMCQHILTAAIAEAVRVDSIEFPEEE